MCAKSQSAKGGSVCNHHTRDQSSSDFDILGIFVGREPDHFPSWTFCWWTLWIQSWCISGDQCRPWTCCWNTTVLNDCSKIMHVNGQTRTLYLLWGFPFEFGSHLKLTLLDQHATATGAIPWYLVDDKAVLVVVEPTEKRISTVADALCDVTRARGITEIRMVDHALAAKVKAMVSNKKR